MGGDHFPPILSWCGLLGDDAAGEFAPRSSQRFGIRGYVPDCPDDSGIARHNQRVEGRPSCLDGGENGPGTPWTAATDMPAGAVRRNLLRLLECPGFGSLVGPRVVEKGLECAGGRAGKLYREPATDRVWRLPGRVSRSARSQRQVRWSSA
jgi:hypothetical protein